MERLFTESFFSNFFFSFYVFLKLAYRLLIEVKKGLSKCVSPPMLDTKLIIFIG